ncbi:outer membrane protein assembly factor BamE domain-containing protein [Aromatoleum sp.]|uniref:outer membrane protein assembly factor BamE domain-containing protein n=1 Tax=Aromatoleum sp. TaxID=2307007 RepID=UPI002FCBC6E5
MKRLIALLCTLLAAIGLAACDYFALRELEPGVSTAVDVRDRLGKPGMEWRNEDGSATWEYSRQPEGTQCYMVTIGPDGVLGSIEQVLNESGFARIKRGMTGNDVRRILGRPATEQYLELAGETVWNWHIESPPPASDPTFFTVHFNNDGRVVKTSRNTEYRGG